MFFQLINFLFFGRTMISSEQFHNLVSNTKCTSNLHVMIKMKPDESTQSRSFIPRIGFKLPTKGNHAVINFSSKNVSPNCSCQDFEVFENTKIEKSEKMVTSSVQYCNEVTASKPNENYNWYQVKDTLRHFSDVQIDGTAVADLWMNPSYGQHS